MALIQQGGSDPYAGLVSTTRGFRPNRPMVCPICFQRQAGLFTVDSNGRIICGDCSGSLGAGILTDDVVHVGLDADQD